jgi:hypothetical protein
MVRSILAVISGFLWLLILTNIATVLVVFVLFSSGGNIYPTPGFLIINAAFNLLFAIPAGFITASISKETPQRDIAILALVIFIFSIASLFLITRVSQQPVWYSIILIILIPLTVLIGGQIKIKRVKKEEDSRYS